MKRHQQQPPLLPPRHQSALGSVDIRHAQYTHKYTDLHLLHM